MKLILQENDTTVEVDIDPEDATEQSELMAYKLHSKLRKAKQRLDDILQDKFKEEKLKERQKLRVAREQAHGPQKLWEEDPGINSPEDYI